MKSRSIKTMGLKNNKSESIPSAKGARHSSDGRLKGTVGAPRPDRTKRPNIGTR